MQLLTECEEGCAPYEEGAPPLHPGFQQNFGNLTQSGSRDGAQALLNWKLQPSLTALFALAALRSVSRRATFCHKTRPICHFELVGKSVLFFPLVSSREHSVFSIRGTADSLPPRMLEGFIYINQYR